MATPAQIEEQVKLEREAIQCGIDKLYKNTKLSEEREYASSSVYGTASIKQAQEAVATEIAETFWKLRKGQNGKNFAEIKQYLSSLDNIEGHNILANIALKRIFDLVFSVKRRKDSKDPNTVTSVTLGIGHSIEQELMLRWYEEKDPKLLHNIKQKYWKSTTGTRQKASVTRLMMTREDICWKPWSPTVRSLLGAFLVDVVCRTTGWFDRVNIRVHGKTPGHIVPSDLYLKIQKDLIDQALLFAPLALPMIIEPNDWDKDHCGGYLLNEVMRGHDLIRHGNRHLIPEEECYSFLNRLQKVGYKVNNFVLEVAKELEEKGLILGKFKPLSHAALWEHPAKPFDIDTNDIARFQWRKDKTKSENEKKAYMKSLHVRTTLTLEMANKFKDAAAFYLPWSFDYRGRAYPIPSFLTPHDTDFGKSMLRFSDEAEMTEEAKDWLAFQVATTYGLDKAPMHERLEWVDNNFTLISAVAHDPLGNLGLWDSVDEPWQFLAACEEFTACVIDKSRHTTGLMVAVDATCSGLQVLAGLARDASTARLVNVLPADKPQDAYKTVADAMLPDVPDRWKPYFSRSTTKRSVMTIPYNATINSSKDYIKKDLMERKPPEMDPPTKEELMQMAKALRAAMDVVAPGPLRVMDWIGKEMYKAIKRGNDVIKWRTPSGFPVEQRKDHFTTKQISTQIMGRCRYNLWDGPTGPNPRKHKSSGAPNLIHSLDASLLHLAFQRFDVPFSVIHDSVLCRATDMSALSTIVRETYMHLFAEHDYLTDFAQQIGAETEPPIIGDLKPESVIESTYFFC